MPAEDPSRQSLLIVEDDDVLRSRLARAFRARDFEVREAADAESGLRLAREDPPELALVDLRLPGASGLDAVRSLLELDPGTSVVVLTGYGSIATALEAIRLGAAHYLTKPADVEEILAGFARRKAIGPAPASCRIAERRHPVARAGRVGAHQPRAGRLRRQRLAGGARARHPPPLAPAQALQVPVHPLKRGGGVTGARRGRGAARESASPAGPLRSRRRPSRSA